LLEAELLDIYYRELLKCGVRNFSEQQLHEDYRLGLLVAVVIPINASKLAKELVPPDENAPELEHQQFRESKVALDALMELIAPRAIQAVMDSRAGDAL